MGKELDAEKHKEGGTDPHGRRSQPRASKSVRRIGLQVQKDLKSKKENGASEKINTPSMRKRE